jgi:hypothetical protein
MYIRARATPVNPNTVQQQLIRGFVSQLTSAWLDILTELQRAAWDLYATQVPLLDRLGEPRNVGGLKMYIRSNVPRLQGSQPRVDDAPTIFNLGAYTPITLGIVSEAAQDLPISFAATDAWVGEAASIMAIWSSRPQNASINYFKGPYRLAGFILGDPIAPPVPPVSITVAFPFVEDQKVFIRINVSRADGRLAAESRTFSLAVA